MNKKPTIENPRVIRPFLRCTSSMMTEKSFLCTNDVFHFSSKESRAEELKKGKCSACGSGWELAWTSSPKVDNRAYLGLESI